MWHLLWIVPIVFICGYMVAALFYIGEDVDKLYKHNNNMSTCKTNDQINDFNCSDIHIGV